MEAIFVATDFYEMGVTDYVGDMIALVAPGVGVAIAIIGSLWAARKLLSLVKRQTV